MEGATIIVEAEGCSMPEQGFGKLLRRVPTSPSTQGYLLGRYGGGRSQSTKPPPDVEDAVVEDQSIEKKIEQPPVAPLLAPVMNTTDSPSSLPGPTPTALHTPASTADNSLQEVDHVASGGKLVKLQEASHIPEYERRAVLLWILWQKRRAVASNAEEKAQIDDDKRVLKEFLRSKQAMRELVTTADAPVREGLQVPWIEAQKRAVMKWILADVNQPAKTRLHDAPGKRQQGEKQPRGTLPLTDRWGVQLAVQ